MDTAVDDDPDLDATVSGHPEPGPALPAGMTGEPGPLLRLIGDQRIAFLVVGGINTGLGTLYFLVWQLVMTHAAGWEVSRGHFLQYMAVLLFAHVCAVPSAFVLYRRVVFRVRGHVWRDLARFELVNLTGFAANLLLLPLVIELFDLPAFASQVLVTGVLVVITYFGHKEFSFRRGGAETAGPDPAEAPPVYPGDGGVR